MSKLSILLIGLFYLVSLNTTLKAQDDTKYFFPLYEFQAGEKVYLYGDNVKFREEPNTSANTIEQLPVGTEVEILSATNQKMKYEGLEHTWYKVKYKDREGYILGGLLSLDKRTLPNKQTELLFAYRYHDERYYLDIRAIEGNKIVSQLPVLLRNESFSFEISGNKGLKGIGAILQIDYMAEACGVEGGYTYITWNQKELKHLADLSQIGDAGVYSFAETFIFPNDEGGQPDKVIYDKEIFNVDNDELNWHTITTEHREYTWDGTELVPVFINGD